MVKLIIYIYIYIECLIYHIIGKRITFNIRYQLWPLDKKVRVVRQAKDYLKRHASEVEQKLSHDRTFKGRLKKAKLQVIKWMQVLISVFLFN